MASRAKGKVEHDPLGGPEEAAQIAQLQPVKVAGGLEALRIDEKGAIAGQVEVPLVIYAKDFGDLVGVVARALARTQVELEAREAQSESSPNGHG